MESYLLGELLPLIAARLPIDAQRLGIFGHSMGGHGALTLALRHPGRFKSLSAFAPIANPVNCPWGQKAFSGYLGDDRKAWEAHDASCLMAAQTQAPYPAGILVDQGLADKFLIEKQLLPEAFEAACAQAGQPLTLRRHGGYDHGYYFIQSFIDDHLRHHAKQLSTPEALRAFPSRFAGGTTPSPRGGSCSASLFLAAPVSKGDAPNRCRAACLNLAYGQRACPAQYAPVPAAGPSRWRSRGGRRLRAAWPRRGPRARALLRRGGGQFGGE